MRRTAKLTLTMTTTLMFLAAAPAPASAHCDRLDGPVVADARRALDT